MSAIVHGRLTCGLLQTGAILAEEDSETTAVEVDKRNDFLEARGIRLPEGVTALLARPVKAARRAQERAEKAEPGR